MIPHREHGKDDYMYVICNYASEKCPVICSARSGSWTSDLATINYIKLNGEFIHSCTAKLKSVKITQADSAEGNCEDIW
jgi:hypothetical protein